MLKYQQHECSHIQSRWQQYRHELDLNLHTKIIYFLYSPECTAELTSLLHLPHSICSTVVQSKLTRKVVTVRKSKSLHKWETQSINTNANKKHMHMQLYWTETQTYLDFCVVLVIFHACRLFVPYKSACTRLSEKKEILEGCNRNFVSIQNNYICYKSPTLYT